VRSDHSLCDLNNLVPGNHLCALYRTEEERRSVLVSFVRQGLERDEKVLYIKDGPADEQILDDLASYGIPVETYLQRGQLHLLSLEETYLLDGLFDPDRMIRMRPSAPWQKDLLPCG